VRIISPRILPGVWHLCNVRLKLRSIAPGAQTPDNNDRSYLIPGGVGQ